MGCWKCGNEKVNVECEPSCGNHVLATGEDNVTEILDMNKVKTFDDLMVILTLFGFNYTGPKDTPAYNKCKRFFKDKE